jgi:glycosyltransferase involved in cell wall biosynthesis
VNAGKVFDVPEIGYDPAIFYAEPRHRGDRLKFLYAGRLVPYKLPEFAVLAFAARPELRKHRLCIVGAGPEQARLEQLVAENGLQDCVEFVGRLSQGEVAEEMRKADVFFFPSVRELGAGVVIEAQACGLPCLVADYGAPGALVNDSRGRRVPLGDRAEMIRGFADAAVDLASDPVALEQMSAESASYAHRTFTWEKKAASTMTIYEWVLGRRSDRPEFVY